MFKKLTSAVNAQVNNVKTSGQPAAPLAPVNPPLGLNLKFCFPQEQVLEMKEKGIMSGSFTGDDFSIRTTSGMDVCKVKGKVMSISDRKGIYRLTILWLQNHGKIN